MTEDEMKRAAWEHMAQQAARQQAADAEAQMQFVMAQRRAEISQAEINNRPRRKYSMIVACDLHGAFSKNGEIPWYYKEDFQWFQRRTKGHICVMGRTTYDDINKRLGDKAAQSVLPDRECYVVTSTPLPRNNATAISRLAELDKILGPAEVDSKTVFFCGGERIYSEGIAYCDQAIVTIVNKEVEGDRFIPRDYLLKYFQVSQVFKAQDTEDIRFVVYTRK